MNPKLLRSDYYNEDYPLNSQEEKEFYLPVCLPYYKIRARAFLLDLDIFGSKSSLSQQVELFLFNSPEKKLPSKSDCEKVSNCDFFEKRFGFLDASLPTNKNNSLLPIYTVIPEIKALQKNISYSQTYLALGKLCDPQMLFINMFKEKPENNLINALIYFPFTPDDIEHLSNDIIIQLAQYYGLCSNNYSCSQADTLKILRQQLIDTFYLCDDLVDLHGVTDCHSVYELCTNMASLYCSNNLCKTCCELAPKKSFCVIHDDFVNFYRSKMQDILNYEQLYRNFDRTRTVRVSIRKRITKHAIKEIFEENGGYEIDWDNIEIKFNTGINKIQYLYLICKSNESAKKLYEDKSKLTKKFEKFDLGIQCLMQDMKSIIDSCNNLFTSCLLCVPCSNLVKNFKKNFPQKSERNKKFVELIENTLNIDHSCFTIKNCPNLISNEFISYDYYIVTFNSKELMEKFYYSQPFYECVIVHKLTHLTFFPVLRNKCGINWRNMCINCIQNKNENCYFDLCSECCNKQQCYLKELITNKIGECPCKASFNSAAPVSLNDDNNKLCEVCKSKQYMPNCQNHLCDECCLAQLTPYNICYIHNAKVNNVYFKQKLNVASQYEVIYNIEHRKSILKLTLMNCLRNGDFSFFRPIADTNLTRLMLDMNKELMIIMDNPNYKREGPLKINDKMYKVFTYQNEKPITKTYDSFKTEEAFDEKGDFYIEYDFTNNNNNNEMTSLPNVYVDVSSEKVEIVDVKGIEKEFINNNINSSSSDLTKSVFCKLNFHLCLYGLDNEKLTAHELIEDVYHELKSLFGKINKEDIQLLSEESIMNMFINQNDKNIYNIEHFENYGRFITVKFRSDKDALKVYLEKIKLVLPLVNNKKGSPMLIIGDLLRKYIDQN